MAGNPMAGNPMAGNPTAAILHLLGEMFHNKELPDNLYSKFFPPQPHYFLYDKAYVKKPVSVWVSAFYPKNLRCIPRAAQVRHSPT
jgi:hypothetical protein